MPAEPLPDAAVEAYQRAYNKSWKLHPQGLHKRCVAAGILAALPHLSRPATTLPSMPQVSDETLLSGAFRYGTELVGTLNPGLPSPAREEIAAVMEERDAYLEAYTKASKHVGEMNRERDRLREALRPFARHGDYIAEHFADHADDVVCGGLAEDPITMRDFRRAHAAALPHINPGIPSPAREEIAALIAERDEAKSDVVILHNTISEIKAERDALAARVREAAQVLSEAKLQIEYLHEKFGETGSGNGVLARIIDAGRRLLAEEARS